MNANIFNPKGTINQSLFLLNYILLLTIYIFGGLFLFMFIYKHNLNIALFIIPLVIIKLLIMFNYKKRLMDISNNLILSIILSFIFTVDVEALALCQLIKNSQTATTIFIILTFIVLFIQPLIVMLIPKKNIDDKDN